MFAKWFIAFPITVFAGAVLAILVIAHLAAWFGIPILPPEAIGAIVTALFPLWLATIISQAAHRRDLQARGLAGCFQRSSYEQQFEGAPAWAIRALPVIFLYAFVHFFFTLYTAGQFPGPHTSHSPPLNAALAVRLFTGHIAVFYSVVLLTFLAQFRRP